MIWLILGKILLHYEILEIEITSYSVSYIVNFTYGSI
nr:MAG TPA: hypothetical protein [Bacteriophage sp.]